MSIQDIRDPAAIRAAMEEYDRVGRAYFLDKYGFSEAREYMLHEPATGCLYDSKAIVGSVWLCLSRPGAIKLLAISAAARPPWNIC